MTSLLHHVSEKVSHFYFWR